MTITHKLKIDLMRQEIYPPVSVVQGDTYSREVAISLYSGGAPWELPNGHDIAIRYSKPDGTPGIYDTLPDGSRAWSTDGNTVSVMLCPQMLTCPGKVSAQVIIIVGERILATFPFTVAVAPDPSAGTVRSEPYYNWRNAFLPQTTGAKVGQYLQISKVDDVGRIIEMAPAENPAVEATNKAYEALRIANDVAQEMKAYSPSGTRSIAEAAMRRANSRLVAPQSASVGQYFRVKEVDANGVVTAVEAVDAPDGGMTNAEKNLILALFRNAAYATPNMADALAQLAALWSGGEVEPDEPDAPDEPDTEKTLTSISVAYSGGSVTAGTAVSELTGIVVTAHYSDGTSETVAGYTLSGTIAEGSNTIAVSYGGKTATFVVTGVTESADVSNETKWTNGVAYEYAVVENEYVETNGTITTYNNWNRTPYLYCKGASILRAVVNTPTTMLGTNNKYNCFYDENKNFINGFSFDGIDVNTSGAYTDITIPDNAAYFIASHKAGVIGVGPYVSNALGFVPYA